MRRSCGALRLADSAIRMVAFEIMNPSKADNNLRDEIEEALRCLTLIGYVPRSENTWADRCVAATEVLQRVRVALFEDADQEDQQVTTQPNEGRRWTLNGARVGEHHSVQHFYGPPLNINERVEVIEVPANPQEEE